MRFLANENFPSDAVEALRADGHDVLWIRIAAPGINDLQVLEWAQREDRILLTLDKDFGELAFRLGLPASAGIILFRIAAPSSAYIAQLATGALNSRNDWAGHFSVIEDRRIRMTPLPPTPAR
jgi:predicted nuclease of predicted toxin-antitoxin system